MAMIANEILVRMDEAGVLQGAHCKFFDTVSRQYGDAMSFEAAAAAGFPLHDVLTQVETGAIVAAQRAIAERELLAVEKDALKAELAVLRGGAK